MDLQSGHPYWLLKNGLMENYPSLDKDLNTEVVVLGAVPGALVTYLLAKQGVQVVVVSRTREWIGAPAPAQACSNMRLTPT